MEDASQAMHAYYAARAPYYDEVYLKPERAADLAFLSSALPARLASLNTLEVACGTGFWTQYIAPHCAQYLATDGTAEPLEFAKLRPGCGHCRFEIADAYALPASLGQFQAAFAGLWFSHVARQRRAEFLHSLHARLEPGALVVLIDNSSVQCKDFPIVETDADGNTFQMRPLKDGSQHRVLKNFPHEAEMLALLPAGATALEWRLLDNFWLFAYRLQS